MDRLNELPDDILISIISRLPFQEATATSILSTRWRHLHAHVLSLNFQFAFTGDIRKVERESKLFSDYISRINHAMKSYKGDMHVSNALRVHIPRLGEDFDKWLEFALSRKVEIIDLRVVPCSDTFFCGHIVFSNWIATMCKQYSLLGVKELSLSSICLDDKDFELILSKFAFLEHLSIDSPGKLFEKKWLINPSVASHAKLTHLSISNVPSISSIGVRDMMNLVSLRFSKFSSYRYIVYLKNVPKLIHFNTDDERHYKMQFPYSILDKISCIHRQLLHLQLSISLASQSDEFTFPILQNLKHLELNVVMDDTSGTHPLYPLIGACPSLEKLDIKFSWLPEAEYVHRKLRWNRVNRRKRSLNLKKVRFSGCFGSVSESELAMYLINNAVGLQELIVKASDITPEIRQGAIAHLCNHLQSVPLNSVNIVII